MHDQQRDDHHGCRHPITRESDDAVEGRQPRHVVHQLRPDQRRQHDQEREGQDRHRADQHIEDRLQPQQPPGARLARVIGAVEADAQALHSARREVKRKGDAEGEHVAARVGEHAGDVLRYRPGHFRRPGFQQQARGLVGQFLGAEEEAGQRGDHDQEREQRHQRGQRDVAGDRPAVVGGKMADRVQRDAQRRFDQAQWMAPGR